MIYTLKGQLRPKKNNMMIMRNKHTGKSFIGHGTKKEKSWDGFILQARAAWKGKPLSEDTIIQVRYFRADRRRVDTTNLNSALADILQAAGVVTDDRHLHIWAGPVLYDKDNPRVEFYVVSGQGLLWEENKRC